MWGRSAADPRYIIWRNTADDDEKLGYIGHTRGITYYCYQSSRSPIVHFKSHGPETMIHAGRPTACAEAGGAEQGAGRADGRGYWLAERILHMRRAPRGGIEVLVRWAGRHDDTWQPYVNLKPAFKRAARLWARAVLGGRAGNSTAAGVRDKAAGWRARTSAGWCVAPIVAERAPRTCSARTRRCSRPRAGGA